MTFTPMAAQKYSGTLMIDTNLESGADQSVKLEGVGKVPKVKKWAASPVHRPLEQIRGRGRRYSIFTNSPCDRADSNIQRKNMIAKMKYTTFNPRPHWKCEAENPPFPIACRIPSND